MYQIGDVVIYGSEGVCRVKEIGCPDIPDINTERKYYTLVPEYRDGVIYTPVNTTVFMRPVITKERARELVKGVPCIIENPCEDKNLRILSEHYDKYLNSHNCEDLVQLIKTVYQKKQTALQQGRKPGAVDERYMKRAEELLYGELAVVLEIPREQVVDVIKDGVENGTVRDAV